MEVILSNLQGWRLHSLSLFTVGQPHCKKEISQTIPICGHCLCSSHWTAQKKSWLCPLCTLPSGDSPEPSQQSWERCQGQIPAGCSYPPACPSCVWKSWITFPMDLGEADWPIVPLVLLAHTEDGSDFCFPSGTSASCPDQSVSRVALQWHLPAPSAFMDTSHQSPWTHMCPICLSIPWPDPLPPRLHLLCYSLSLCSQGPGIPESWSSRGWGKGGFSISVFSMSCVTKSPVPFGSGLPASLAFLLPFTYRSAPFCLWHPSPDLLLLLFLT